MRVSQNVQIWRKLQKKTFHIEKVNFLKFTFWQCIGFYDREMHRKKWALKISDFSEEKVLKKNLRQNWTFCDTPIFQKCMHRKKK